LAITIKPAQRPIRRSMNYMNIYEGRKEKFSSRDIGHVPKNGYLGGPFFLR